MNELFAKIKRLLEPRPRPAENVEEPTADRPPPHATEPPRAEAPRVEAAEPPRAESPPPEPPPVEAAPSREPASLDVDDLAEVRAALEAVAEPVTPVRVPASALPPAPTLLPPPTEETVDAPAPVTGRVGDALILTLGTPPTTFTVAKTSATLGRGQENTIRLDDLSVSRRHARIAYRQGGYWLSDLGSMGGTWVDGTRLNAPRRIAAAEVIDIGLCRLTVSFTVGPAKAETRKGVSAPRSEIAAQVRRRR